MTRKPTSTPRKKAKVVKAWANVTKRGAIATGLISSVRELMILRAQTSKRFQDKPVRVEIHIPVKK